MGQPGVHYAEDQPAALAHHSVCLPKAREVVLHCLADVHVAADRHCRKDLEERLRAVKKGGPNHRLILHGDLMDYRNRAGKSFRHGAMSPQDEFDEVVRILKPYADHIDLILHGNHEWRGERDAGLHPMQQLAALLGRPQSYRHGPTVVRFCYAESSGNHGQCRLRAQVLVHHGFGGGTPGAASNNIEKLANWKQDVDAVLMGHNHQNGVRKRVVYTSWPPRKHEQTLILTGTWVDHEQYAADCGLHPSWVGAPTIVLGGNIQNGISSVKASIG